MVLLYCLPIILYFVRVLRFCDSTMRIWPGQFNLYFAPALALALLCGCQTDKNKSAVAALRVHIEVTVPTATSQTVSILRSTPMLATILTEAILTEADIAGARIINAPGGFALQIQFNENAAWILEQYSAANPGKHFAIFGQWGEKLKDGRWLSAPLITRRIADGVLTFTPDASRDEMDNLVLGLNNVAQKIRKGQLKTFR